MKHKNPERVSLPVLKLYLNVMRRHKKDYRLSWLLVLNSLFLSVAIPYFASASLSAAILGRNDFIQNLLFLCISVLLAIITNRVGFNAEMRMQANSLYDLQHLAFKTMLNRGIRFHINNIGGKLVSDVVDFVGAFSTLMNAFYGIGTSLTLTIIGGLTVIYINSWQLGVYLTITVTIMIYWAYLESNKRYSLRHRRLKAQKAVTSHLSDTIVNAATVKTFAAEKREIIHGDALSRTLRELRKRDWQRAGTSGNNRMAVLLILLIGLIIAVRITSHGNPALLGTSIFAFTFTMTLILRLFDINNLTRQIEEVFLQASPMAKILLEESEVKDVPAAPSLSVTKGAIHFKNISFAYQDSKSNQNIFTKLDLKINPGERVGFVGPSGGGKSTLTHLLLRFEDVQAGEVLIDGQNISKATQSSLRDAVGYVPQEPLLFHRSIKENIAYGKPIASQASIQKAASMAYAHDFIEELSDGYDTVVGERGVKLSGGQRQRIAIARAILKDAPILVLDEATSALDSESEQLIQEAMWQLIDGKTALIIAHRLSTIQRMDRIIVLDHGQIVEQGSHKELLKLDGVYAKLWKHQSGGFLKED